MKKKGLLKLVIPISLVAVLAVALPLTSGCRPAPPAEVEPVVIGYIGGFASDWGKSCMRAMQIAIDEFNEAGGILGGRPIEFAKADSAEDVAEGVKAYEYLNEVQHADLIISACIDDVSLGWLPRLVEYRTPTIDTWTSAIRAIEMLQDDYEAYKPFFMSHGNDYHMGYEFLLFGKEVLHDQMGWETMILFNEDTAYGVGVAEFIEADMPAYAGIEILDHVVYDVDTVDFSPIYAGMVATDPDFIYWISSVNAMPPACQYVELRVPVPIAGINADAIALEYWEDTGGVAAGISTLGPSPAIGMEHDPETLAFIDKYQARYPTRPVFPHFNAFYTYVDLQQAVAAAEEVYQAGLGSGFEPLDAWVEAMLKQETILYKDGEIWYRYAWYGPGEVEPLTGLTYPHNCRFDPEGEEGMVALVAIQWYEGGICKVIWPDKYAIGEFEIPWWIEQE